MTLAELREQVCHANKMLPATGLVTMHSGNASGLDRGLGRLVIKPSGVDYETLSPGDLVEVDLESGRVIESELRPSVDLPHHLYLYRHLEDVGSIVHTHSNYATAFAAVVLDLSEAMAAAEALADDDPDVQKLVAETGVYADVSSVKPQSVLKSAKLELFLRRFKEEHGIDAFGIQCWTSMQANYGVCSCLSMSRLGNEGIPCACEADIMGTLSMHAAMLASGSPCGLADWNNLHNEDDELANLWHCGVFPASLAKTRPKVGVQEIIASSGAAKYEDSEGTVEFLAKPSPLTLFRVTQDAESGWHAVVAEGKIEDNSAETFGAYGWCRIPNLQRLYRDVLLRHFPHHVAITQSHVGNVLWEAFGNYLGMNVYHAAQEMPGLYTPRLPF